MRIIFTKQFLLITCLYVNNVFAESETTIKGFVKGMADSNIVMLYKYPREKHKEDSAWVIAEKFELKVKLNEPGIYILVLGREAIAGNWLELYLNRGETYLACNDLFFNYEISGCKEALEYDGYRGLLEKNNFYQQLKEVANLTMQREITQDSSLTIKITRTLVQMGAKRKTLAKDWIHQHPLSPVSSFILYMHLRNAISKIELGTILSNLDKEAKQNNWSLELQEIAESIHLSKVGAMAPLFSQKDTTGQTFSLVDFRGTYVLIEFWSSWCAPCRAENPHLKKLYQNYHSKGFEILGVSLDREKEPWLKAIIKDQLPWIQLSDLQGFENSVAKLYNVEWVPSNFLIDKEGRIIATNTRGNALKRQLEKLLD